MNTNRAKSAPSGRRDKIGSNSSQTRPLSSNTIDTTNNIITENSIHISNVNDINNNNNNNNHDANENNDTIMNIIKMESKERPKSNRTGYKI